VLPLDGFLLAWLALEVIAALVLSPFAATRRLMGIVLVSTLLMGRLACRARVDGTFFALRRRVSALAVAGAALGLAFYVAEFHDAWAVERGAAASARWARSNDVAAGRSRPGTLWYVGRWGFRYYADRAGMKIVTPGRDRLQPGDWLAVPDASIIKPAVRFDDPDALRLAATITETDLWPVRTLPVYYNGPVPWQPRGGPRFTVHLFRVVRPITTKVDGNGPGVRYDLAAVVTREALAASHVQ
jgi:hypothetical protein